MEKYIVPRSQHVEQTEKLQKKTTEGRKYSIREGFFSCELAFKIPVEILF